MLTSRSESKEPKDDRQEKYQAKLKEYKAKSIGGSSLYKHITPCLDESESFSSQSVGNRLAAMHEPYAKSKGSVISLFNSSHTGHCPFFKVKVEKTTDLSPSLHLGTTRVWNPDGSLNDARWKELLEAVTEENQTIVRKSKLFSYLAQHAEKDPEEKTTGRNTSSFFSSKSIQVFAASAAWGQVFDSLACGWRPVSDKAAELEPYLSVEVLTEFFVDSPVAYLRAECGLLPVPKPTAEERTKPSLVA